MLIGLLGGLVTGVSPCILPVLPVIFLAGARTATHETAAPHESGGVAVAVEPKRALSKTLRPFTIIGGLVLSFSLVTLTGTTLLAVLHLPQDAIRWIGWSHWLRSVSD